MLTLLTGDVARRFLAREPALARDPALIDQLVNLLAAREPAHGTDKRAIASPA